MACLWGKMTGRLKHGPPAGGDAPLIVTGTTPRKNDETPGQDGATARDPRGRPERCEATTSAACAPSGPSPLEEATRDGPARHLCGQQNSRHRRGLDEITLDATESASSSSSSTNSAHGVRPPARPPSSSREGRARVPEPELDAGGLERRQRRARALGAPAVVVAWGSAAAESSSRGSAARSRDPPPCNEETVAGPSTPSTRLEDVQGRRLRTVDQQTTPRRRSARRRARRLELRLFFHSERRGLAASAPPLSSSMSARRPRPLCVRLSRRWRLGGVKQDGPWAPMACRGDGQERRRDEGQDAGAIPADAAEPAPEARVLGARDGPHRGPRAPRAACPSLARAAATAVAAPACVFFGGVFPSPRPRDMSGTHQHAIAATVKAPHGRRMSDLEQERRVARGRAVREARLDGGDDAARHAVAVSGRACRSGAPRLVAGRLEPREALVPLVGPALGGAGPTSAPRRAPRRRPASASASPPSRAARRRSAASASGSARRRGAGARDVDAAGSSAMESLRSRAWASTSDFAARSRTRQSSPKSALGARPSPSASGSGVGARPASRGEGSASSAAESAESESPMRAASRAASSSATFVVVIVFVV